MDWSLSCISSFGYINAHTLNCCLSFIRRILWIPDATLITYTIIQFSAELLQIKQAFATDLSNLGPTKVIDVHVNETEGMDKRSTDPKVNLNKVIVLNFG